MINLIDFEDLNFFDDNPNFIKSIYDSRYKDTIYSIKKIGRNWVIYIIDEEIGFFEVLDNYSSKKKAIEAIESGSLKKELFEQYYIYKRLREIL